MKTTARPLKDRIESAWYRRPAFARTVLAFVVCTTIALVTVPTFSRGPRAGDAATFSVPSRALQRWDINALFYDYELLNLDLKEMAGAARTNGRVSLPVKSGSYDLELEPNEILAPGFRAVMTTGTGMIEETLTEVHTYRGRITGQPDSDVRLLIHRDLISGYLRTGTEWVFLDPLSKYLPGAQPGQVIAYRDADVRPEARGMCGAEGLEKQAERLLKGGVRGAALPVTRIIEVATDADFEFFQANGANSNAVIQGVINQVDGIYLSELNMTLRITFQNVYATADDPYTATDASTLLGEFTNYWNANRGNVPRDVAHLFSGRSLGGTTVGLAWVGTVCNFPTYAYGISVPIASYAKLVAHEMGHNFNAAHDDPSICTGAGPIMCAFVQNGPNQFSQVSEDTITTFALNFGICLD